MKKADRKGIVRGNAPGVLSPTASIKRQDAAVMIFEHVISKWEAIIIFNLPQIAGGFEGIIQREPK
jgi:hypothetical protein